MKVKILFFAELKDIFGPSCLVDLPEDATIEAAVNLLVASHPAKLFSKQTSFIYAINEKFETIEAKLKDQDELALMTAMSGG